MLPSISSSLPLLGASEKLICDCDSQEGGTIRKKNRNINTDGSGSRDRGGIANM